MSVKSCRAGMSLEWVGVPSHQCSVSESLPSEVMRGGRGGRRGGGYLTDRTMAQKIAESELASVFVTSLRLRSSRTA